METPTQTPEQAPPSPAEDAVNAKRATAKDKRPKGPSAITVSGVNKTFKIPRHRPSTLKERVLHPFRVIPTTELKGAQDLNFEVSEGEFFGVVGRNGSGKSTLLKLLAGIYTPDDGEIEVKGRVSPFIELGVGFNPELTARDNVVVNGTMLGLSRTEIKRRYPDILSFAGLEEFEEMKLKNYSSGMMVRLAFSTAIQVDADVLLFDEVLAVGDSGFQEKCFEQFRQMRKEGKTLVLVTHAMEFVRRFCDRAIMLEEGKIVASGDPEEVAEHYRELAAEESDHVGAFLSQSGRFGSGGAEVNEAWVEDGDGERTEVLKQGEPMVICAEFEFERAIKRPVFGVQVKGEFGFDVFAMNTLWADVETGEFAAGDRASFRVKLDNHLGVGAYSLTLAVANSDGTSVYDLRLNFSSFRVDGERWTGAAADLPCKVDVERAAGPR